VGRYTIYDQIAAGGLGSVHFARLVGPGGFSRTVAAKRPHAHLAQDEGFALMFMDEARLAARIRHPNVVSTIDVIHTPTDLVLVMDYVHGEALSKLTRGNGREASPVPLPIAASILIDTLNGLHAAHEANDEQGQPLGIVHRDVSPQNILVGLDGIARIVDFGIAKATGRLQATTNAARGEVKGKYAYMAPEQVRGEAVSRLTDTFAASIVFWEMLTGERLFLGRTDAESIHKVLVARVRRPSSLVPDIPKEIDDIVMKGLSRETGQRYQTAREMALNIEAFVPPIRLSEVGAWVEQRAGDSLAARAATLAAIERAEANDDLIPTNSLGSGEPRRSIKPAGEGADALGQESSGDRPHTEFAATVARDPAGEVSIASVQSKIVAARQRKPRTALWASLTFLVVLGSGTLVLMRRVPGADPPMAHSSTEQPPEPPSAQPLSALPAPSATGVQPPPPAASWDHPSPSSSASTAQIPPQPPRGPHHSGGGSSAGSQAGGETRGAAVRPKAAGHCDPPYTIDSIGIQHFKPECM